VGHVNCDWTLNLVMLATHEFTMHVLWLLNNQSRYLLKILIVDNFCYCAFNPNVSLGSSSCSAKFCTPDEYPLTAFCYISWCCFVSLYLVLHTLLGHWRFTSLHINPSKVWTPNTFLSAELLPVVHTLCLLNCTLLLLSVRERH
jgi:hypothetical protein